MTTAAKRDAAAALDISDPSEWLPTPLPGLAPVDAALRCQVCKDFFATPMMTSCAHTFCSLCIRRCLAADGKCPTCRAAEQEVRLRRNWAVDDVVGAFRAARPAALAFANVASAASAAAAAAAADAAGERTRAKKKRKLGDLAEEEKGVAEKDEGGEGEVEGDRDEESSDWELDGRDGPRAGKSSSAAGRTTRSQARQVPNGQSKPRAGTAMRDGDEDSAVTPPDDGLVACPLCGRRMEEVKVYSHLDLCEQEKEARAPSTGPNGLSMSLRSPLSPAPPAPPPTPPRRSTTAAAAAAAPARALERLPKLNYSLLKEGALRKKLAELGLRSTGPKAALERRHTEWVTLWNANCDAAAPRGRRALLHELDAWERSQGTLAPTAAGPGSAVMRKDFDAAAWSASHSDDFQRLIARARAGGGGGGASKAAAVAATEGASASQQQPQQAQGQHRPERERPEQHQSKYFGADGEQPEGSAARAIDTSTTHAALAAVPSPATAISNISLSSHDEPSDEQQLNSITPSPFPVSMDSDNRRTTPTSPSISPVPSSPLSSLAPSPRPAAAAAAASIAATSRLKKPPQFVVLD